MFTRVSIYVQVILIEKKVQQVSDIFKVLHGTRYLLLYALVALIKDNTKQLLVH